MSDLRRAIWREEGSNWRAVSSGKWFDGEPQRLDDDNTVPPHGLLTDVPDSGLSNGRYLIVVVDFDGEIEPEAHFIDVEIVPKTFTMAYSEEA